MLSELHLSHFSRAVGLYSGHSITIQRRDVVVEVFVPGFCPLSLDDWCPVFRYIYIFFMHSIWN